MLRWIVGPVLVVVGLVATFRLTRSWVFERDGIDTGGADCDHCGVSGVLDNIGWFALTLGLYAVLVVVALLVVRRVRGAGREGS